MTEALERVVADFHTVHGGVGAGRAPLSRVLSPRFMDRWSSLIERGGVPRDLGSAVRALAGPDAEVEVSLGHGDLVSSNVLIHDGRVTLIDGEYGWEYGGV